MDANQRVIMDSDNRKEYLHQLKDKLERFLNGLNIQEERELSIQKDKKDCIHNGSCVRKQEKT